MILAFLWVTLLSKQLNLEPGSITMQFGDCHIYEEHINKIEEYINNYPNTFTKIEYALSPEYTTIDKFLPNMLTILNYNISNIVKFELKV